MSKTVTTAELTQQIDAVVARKDKLVEGLTSEQALWRPQPGSWSIAECLEHLNRTTTLYLKLMRVTFERERHNASLPPKAFRLGFLARRFARILEPPYRVRVKAPTAVVPQSSLDIVEVNAEFNRIQLDLRGFVLEASRVDMGSISFASPMASLLKLNLADGCVILLAHDRRHLWQAEKVRQHPSFPQVS
jgi:hypothetical protein